MFSGPPVNDDVISKTNVALYLSEGRPVHPVTTQDTLETFQCSGLASGTAVKMPLGTAASPIRQSAGFQSRLHSLSQLPAEVLRSSMWIPGRPGLNPWFLALASFSRRHLVSEPVDESSPSLRYVTLESKPRKNRKTPTSKVFRHKHKYAGLPPLALAPALSLPCMTGSPARLDFPVVTVSQPHRLLKGHTNNKLVCYSK